MTGRSETPRLVYQPNEDTCGQAVVAMLTGETVEAVIARVGHADGTTGKQLRALLLGREHFEVGEWTDVAAVQGFVGLGIASYDDGKEGHWALWVGDAYLCPLYGRCEPDEYDAYWGRKQFQMGRFLPVTLKMRGSNVALRSAGL